MATVTRENIGTLHDKVTVVLAKADYWPPFEKTLKQYAKTANVPGFRKGMVPTGMISKMYGQSIFTDEVIRIAGQQLEEYLKNEKIPIFAQPMVLPGESPVHLDMNTTTEVDFAFEIGLKPDFEITPLINKAPLTRYKVTVGDKMVEDEIERIKRRYGKTEDQQKVNSKEDILYATYESCDAEGTIDFGAMKTESSSVIDKLPVKLQEMLQDKQSGDSLVIVPATICTPEEMQPFLKDVLKQGADAIDQYFKLTITKIGLLIPKELGQELYLEVYPNEIVIDEADFREKVRKELSTEFERVTGERLQNEIYELLIHNTRMQLPVAFLKRWLREGGEKPKTDQEVESEFGGFEHQLRWTLISDKLIIDNRISVSRDEVIADIKSKVLAYFGMDADEEAPWMEGYMAKVVKDEKTMDDTYRRLLFDKLFKFLETEFTLEDKEVTEEEFFKIPSAHEAHHHHH